MKKYKIKNFLKNIKPFNSILVKSLARFLVWWPKWIRKLKKLLTCANHVRQKRSKETETHLKSEICKMVIYCCKN